MKRIIIEVDEYIADAFMHITKQRQKNISNAINNWLKKVINTSASEKYSQMLDSMSDEAVANGLTPEKLEQMLRNNE